MSVTTFPVMFWSLGQCLVKLENKWAFVWKHFENNTFFLLFFASSTKLSILHGGWKSASLRPFVECSCTRFSNQRVSVKWLSVFICTLVPQCTHLYTCRAILEIILAVSKWFLNLIWQKIFLGPNSFYLRRCMQSVIVNKLHWKNITALKDYRYSRS